MWHKLVGTSTVAAPLWRMAPHLTVTWTMAALCGCRLRRHMPWYVGHMPELSEPEALMVPSEWICTAPQGLEVTAGPVLATYRQRTGPVEPAAAGGRCQAVERQTVPLAFRAFRGDHKGRLRDKVVHRFGHQGRVSPGPQAPQRARECSYPS